MVERLKAWKHSIFYSEQKLRSGWRILLLTGYLELYILLLFLLGIILLAIFPPLCSVLPFHRRHLSGLCYYKGH